MKVNSYIKRLLPKGLKVTIGDMASSTAMEVLLYRIRKIGFRPTRIIDIGAYNGEWTKMARRYWDDVPFVMFEAQEKKIPRLEKIASATGGTVINALLGAEPGKLVKFYEMETGSSIYPEKTNVEREIVEKQLTVLDDELSRIIGNDDLLMKIDVQGAELDVLKGGRNVLDKCEFIILELSFLEYNMGGAGLIDVVSFLDACGFVPFDIATMMRLQTGVLNQVDMAFCKVRSRFRPVGVLF